MHPYAVWIKKVINALARDLSYGAVNPNSAAVTLDIIQILHVELQDEKLSAELESLVIWVNQELRGQHGRMKNGQTPAFDFDKLQEISTTLAVLEVRPEVVASIFTRGRDAIQNTDYKMESTESAFNDDNLTSLLRLRFGDSAIQLEDIVANFPVESQREEENEIISKPALWKQIASSTLIRHSIVFVVVTALSYYLIHVRVPITKFNLLDAMALGLLAATIAFLFFNPKTRYMRVFVATIGLWGAGKTFMISFNSGLFFDENRINGMISNAAASPWTDLMLMMVLLACLILDFIERRNA